jgi:DNA-binding NarL/FixJ family response regulator
MGQEKMLAKQALDRGAAGFVSKALEEPELLMAVTTVLEGGTYLSQEMELYLKQRHGKRTAEAHEDPLAELSERERRVMHELLAGYGVKEIAGRMDLQVSTVATYKARLLDKLGASNVLDLERMMNAARGRDLA